MNQNQDLYLHHKYAGNKGDLWKHFILHEVLAGLNLKPKARVLDSHAGSGIYQLQHAGQWARGLGEIDEGGLSFSKLRSRSSWLDFIWTHFKKDQIYFGSWVQMARFHPSVKISICDHNAALEKMIHKNIAHLGFKDSVNFIQTDSFDYLAKHSARYEFIFIDPAYRLKDGLGDDWQKIHDFLARHHDKKALVWYPLYGPRKPHALIDPFKLSSFEIHWPRKRSSPFVPHGCGMLMTKPLLESVSLDLQYWQSFAGLLNGKMLVRSLKRLSTPSQWSLEVQKS